MFMCSESKDCVCVESWRADQNNRKKERETI